MIRLIAGTAAVRNFAATLPLTLYNLTAALRRRALALLHSLAQSRAQKRKATEPLRRLHNDLEHRIYELRVGIASTEHGRLVRESPYGLQATLHCHQTELARELVRVNRLKPARASLFEEEQT